MGEARRKSRLPRVTNDQVAQHADPACIDCSGKGVKREPEIGMCQCAVSEFWRRAGGRVLRWGGGLRWAS
jgi:hypothetical protein